jgi:hypothetical protein
MAAAQFLRESNIGGFDIAQVFRLLRGDLDGFPDPNRRLI